jgi:hypothetical protein
MRKNFARKENPEVKDRVTKIHDVSMVVTYAPEEYPR